jgi:RNA polymerase sigma-70 factor (ECF subfamily)
VTDEMLMGRVRDGEVMQLGLLFERHHAGLFDFFCRTLGDRTSAEDLVQEVFIRILKYRRTYRDRGCFAAWMFHIARNVRADHLRRHRPDQLTSATPEPAASATGQAAAMEAAQDVDLLRRALMQLPDEKRELIVLARYRGLKHEDIAAVLRIDTGTVRVRVHRALKELRAIVESLSAEDQPCDVNKSGTSLPIL